MSSNNFWTKWNSVIVIWNGTRCWQIKGKEGGYASWGANAAENLRQKSSFEIGRYEVGEEVKFSFLQIWHHKSIVYFHSVRKVPVGSKRLNMREMRRSAQNFKRSLCKKSVAENLLWSEFLIIEMTDIGETGLKTSKTQFEENSESTDRANRYVVCLTSTALRSKGSCRVEAVSEGDGSRPSQLLTERRRLRRVWSLEKFLVLRKERPIRMYSVSPKKSCLSEIGQVGENEGMVRCCQRRRCSRPWTGGLIWWHLSLSHRSGGVRKNLMVRCSPKEPTITPTDESNNSASWSTS